MDLAAAGALSTLRASRWLAPVVAAACTLFAARAEAQQAPVMGPPQPVGPPAPWTAPPPPGCENLPWVWGFPPPQGGPVWYLAPGAPTLPSLPRPKPEPPKPPVSRRGTVKRILTITGSIGFGLSGFGAFMAYSSAVMNYGFGSGWETILIPVVGPFIAAGAAEGVNDVGNSAQRTFLVAGGVVETAFAAMMFTGLAIPGEKKPPPSKDEEGPWVEAPGQKTLTFVFSPTVSSSGGGVALHGSF